MTSGSTAGAWWTTSGRYRRLVTDLNLSVTPEGRLRGVSEASRLFLGPLRIPLPAALDAKAYAEQWWEPQDGGRHRIQVKVIQPQLGLVLVYAGHFDYRLEPYPGGLAAPGYLPGHARPDGWEAGLPGSGTRPCARRRRPSAALAERELVEPVGHLGQPGQDRRRRRGRVPRQALRRRDPRARPAWTRAGPAAATAARRSPRRRATRGSARGGISHVQRAGPEPLAGLHRAGELFPLAGGQGPKRHGDSVRACRQDPLERRLDFRRRPQRSRRRRRPAARR